MLLLENFILCECFLFTVEFKHYNNFFSHLQARNIFKKSNIQLNTIKTLRIGYKSFYGV